MIVIFTKNEGVKRTFLLLSCVFLSSLMSAGCKNDNGVPEANAENGSEPQCLASKPDCWSVLDCGVNMFIETKVQDLKYGYCCQFDTLLQQMLSCEDQGDYEKASEYRMKIKDVQLECLWHLYVMGICVFEEYLNRYDIDSVGYAEIGMYDSVSYFKNARGNGREASKRLLYDIRYKPMK